MIKIDIYASSFFKLIKFKTMLIKIHTFVNLKLLEILRNKLIIEVEIRK